MKAPSLDQALLRGQHQLDPVGLGGQYRWAVARRGHQYHTAEMEFLQVVIDEGSDARKCIH